MNTDDFNGNDDVAEKIASIVMENVAERDEILVARLKSEIKADFSAEFEKRDQVSEVRDLALREEIKADFRAELKAEFEKRDQASEARDSALREEIKAIGQASEARDLALREEIRTRDHELRLAMEKGGFKLWKSAMLWATGAAVTTSGLILALGLLIAQIISLSP